jgi:hypothetical protein
MAKDDDYGIEPVRGLPETPPEGERILWQGAPEAWPLARHALAAGWVGAYFAALAGWRGAVIGAAEGVQAGLLAASWYVAIGALAVGVLALMAWAMARATVYTLTTHRVVMRIGAALSMTINLPYRWIDSADLRMNGDGTGSIELTLKGATRLSYLVLWPHVRPWSLGRARPALRCLRDAREAAAILGAAASARVAEIAPAADLPTADIGPRQIAAE